MKKFIAFMLSIVLLVALVACGEVAPTNITINSSKTTLEIGDVVSATYAVEPANATNVSVSVKSSDPKIATATYKSAGKFEIKAIAAGTVKVTVTSNAVSSIKGEITITVNQKAEVLPVLMVFANEPEQILIGKTAVLQVAFTPANTTNRNVTWETSDEAVATVENGHVTGVSEGTVTITATSVVAPNVKANVTLSVIQGVPVTSVEVTNAPDLLPINIDYPLTAVVNPQDATIKDVTWQSSDESIATVSLDGVLTGHASGEVTITCIAAGDITITDSFTVTIDADAEIPITELALAFANAEKPITYTFDVQKLKVTITPANANNQVLEWESSDESVATVSDNGTVTPVSAGTVTITVKSTDGSNVEASLEFTIQAAVDPTEWDALLNIPLDGIKVGVSAKVQITTAPAAGDPTSTYESLDPSIATVDENGIVTGIAPGITKIRVTSSRVASFKKDIEIRVHDGTQKTDPEIVKINGETTMYVGYPIKLEAIVIPLSAPQGVIWTSLNKNIADVTQEGLVTAVSSGTARIRATSSVNSEIFETFSIEVKIIEIVEPVDLNEYKIVIMQADSALGEIDPFRDDYTATDKPYKQAAWRQVEADFNCKIVVEPYPSSAPWGETRITWIITNATNNNAQFDLGIVASNWIYRFSQANATPDVTDYYSEFGMGQMEPAVRAAGSYRGKLHIASTGISPTATYVTLGLYYNLDMLQKAGLQDPAQIFNEGGWTYTGFKNWVNAANAVLGDDKFVLGGHSYYYWFGMTNAAGIKVADVTTVNINISNQKSKDAAALIYELVQAGAVDTTLTWQETTGSFIDGNTLMTTGYYWFIRNDTRWKRSMWGEGTTSYGYVPFPYPDGMAKEDTRISIDGMTCYLYSNGRPYPEGVDLKGVYQAVNTMFLDTVNRQYEDPNFNVTQKKMAALSNRLDSSHSVTAAMYYTADKVFFDPAHAIYSSTSATPLNSVSQRVLFQGANYDQEFDAVFTSMYDTFSQIYGSS